MKNTLVLIAGAPGSGKTTFAETIGELNPDIFTIAADDYFYDDFNEYHFDFSKLGEAHQWCQDQVLWAMSVEAPLILVHNTFTTKAEMEPYIKLAEKMSTGLFPSSWKTSTAEKHATEYPLKKWIYFGNASRRDFNHEPRFRFLD